MCDGHMVMLQCDHERTYLEAPRCTVRRLSHANVDTVRRLSHANTDVGDDHVRGDAGVWDVDVTTRCVVMRCVRLK